MIKNRSILAIFTSTLILSGCATTTEQSKSTELDTFEKKLSYLFAFDSASQAKDVELKFDIDVIRQAIEDVNNGIEPRLTIEEAKLVSRDFRLLQLEALEN